MKTPLYWNNQQNITLICNALTQDRALITPTDTVLGLLARCTYEGFTLLNRIKTRYEKPYIVLVPDITHAQLLVKKEDHERLLHLGQSCWPGPVTLIFKASGSLPSYLSSSTSTIALRIPHHPQLLEILRQVGPLFSTSANRAGQEVPHTFSALDTTLFDHIEYIVMDKTDMSQEAYKPSTILDCTTTDITLVREGLYKVVEIEQKAHVTIKRGI